MKLERAIAVATDAHKGQVDRAGQPYILHCLRVMLRMDTKEEMVLAVLHDVLEDAPRFNGLLKDELEDNETGIQWFAMLCSLARSPNQPYTEYIADIDAGWLEAKKIKIADLEDNMNLLRLQHLGEEETRLVRRYHIAWRQLRDDR